MPFVTHGERFGVVTLAAANFAGYVNVREKIHFDAAQAVTLTGLAAPAFDVKAKAPRLVTAFARFWKHGKEFANGGKDSRVRGGIRARRAADGSLIDLNHFVDIFDAKNFAVRRRSFRGAIQLLRQRAVQDIVHQRGLARTGD